jgi:WD40-like Beta Propeller Repeat
MKLNILSFFLLLTLSACLTVKPPQNNILYSTETVNKPTLFAEGVINRENRNVFGISFMPNGKTAYFTLRQGNEKQKIYYSQFIGQQWTQPQVASFSTDRDEGVSISPDGQSLYFGSQRPIPNSISKGSFDMNLWRTDWIDGKWCEPVPLPETINKVQVENEQWPSSVENSITTYDGVHYYFATMLKETKVIDIFQTQRQENGFSEPQKINGLFDDDKYWKSTPIFSPDGKYMFFNAYNTPLGKGGEDIYVSKKTVNGWTKAQNIGQLINTSSEEAVARLSPDGKYFFFTREFKKNPDQDGIWNLYFIETKFLNIDNLF